MLKLKAVQVLPGLNFSFTIYSLPLPPACITAKLPINKGLTEVSSMYFFFTSSQVISSLTSTYILPYLKGENQLPLPPSTQPGCTSNFPGRAASERAHVGCGLLRSEQHLMVACGELVHRKAFTPLFIT